MPVDEDDIWNKAAFGMTWKGFFVKNKDGNYYVEVSSTDDIQIVDTKGTSTTNDDVIRVKIGKLSDNVYGFRLKDSSGTTTLETIADGTLWLKDRLYIGTSEDSGYYAGIGYLPLITDSSKQISYNSTNLDTRIISGSSDVIHRTFDINNKFVVWEDGTMYAKDGYFEGTINATDGVFSGRLDGADGTFRGTVAAGAIIASEIHIGGASGPTMGDVGESAYKVVIESSEGTIFKNGTISTILTAKLYQGATQVTSGLTYQWKKGNTTISGATSSTLTVNESVGSGDATLIYSCTITN